MPTANEALARRGIRSAQLGLVINAALAAIKFLAGLVGHTYALVADAVESMADIFSSLIVWGGLQVATRPADVRPALRDLMDRAPGEEIAVPVRRAAESVPGVRGIEKLFLRKSGLAYFVDIHVEADPELSLREAHVLGGRTKAAIRAAVPQVAGVLVHMEPAQARKDAEAGGADSLP